MCPHKDFCANVHSTFIQFQTGNNPNVYMQKISKHISVYSKYGVLKFKKGSSHHGLVETNMTSVPHLLDPLLCQWTFRLFPCLGCCKQCCNEHWRTCVFASHSFLWIDAQEWDSWIKWKFYFQFSEESKHCFPQWLHQCTFPPTD